MHYLKVGAAFLVTLFGCVQYGNSIKCYDCNSFNTPDCNDPFHSTMEPTDCDQALASANKSATFCRKTVQSTILGEKFSERIIRSCGWEKERRLADSDGEEGKYRCYLRTGTFGVEIRYCACEEDKCNGIGIVSAYHGLIATMAIGTIILKSFAF